MRYTKRIAKTLVCALLAAVLTAGAASAAAGSATVTADKLRLRAAASTSSAILAAAPKGAAITLLSAEENGWYKVSYRNKEGYMSAQWLSVTQAYTPAAEEPAAEEPAEEPAGDAAGDTDAAKAPETISAAAPAPVVTASTLNVRSAPSTDAERVGTLKKGAEVVINETLDGWYLITAGDLTGYVSAQYISLDGAVPEEGMVLASSLNVRTGAGTSYSRIGTLKIGSIVTVLGKSGDWYKVSTGSLTGYVSAQYIAILDDLTSSPVGAAAAAMAVSLLGSRYVYGAAGPTTFDCSGLSYYIYKQLGYTLQRGSSGQYRKSGTFVPLSQAEPGDLIFFFDPRFDGSGGTLPTTHMGIYMGNGQFIHASTTSYRVQYDNVYGSYYTPYIVGVKRIG